MPKPLPYAKIYTSLPRHSKTARLCAIADISRLEAVGVVTALHLWASENATGNVTAIFESPAVLADVLLLSGAPVDRVVRTRDALVHVGFVDLSETKGGRRFTIHGWGEKGSGTALEERKRVRERVRKHRGKPNVTVTGALRNADVTPQRERETKTIPPTFGGPPLSLLEACRRAWPDDPWGTDAALTWATAQVAVHGAEFPYASEVAKARAWESARQPKKDHRKFITGWLKGAASDAAKRRGSSNLPPSRQADEFLDLG